MFGWLSASKSLERLLVLRHTVGQEFKRYFPVEPRVFRLIHHTHPACAELADDAVMRDGPADHGVRSISVVVESPICMLRRGSISGAFGPLARKNDEHLNLQGHEH